jgi:hypothetical protein
VPGASLDRLLKQEAGDTEFDVVHVRNPGIRGKVGVEIDSYVVQLRTRGGELPLTEHLVDPPLNYSKIVAVLHGDTLSVFEMLRPPGRVLRPAARAKNG